MGTTLVECGGLRGRRVMWWFERCERVGGAGGLVVLLTKRCEGFKREINKVDIAHEEDGDGQCD